MTDKEEFAARSQLKWTREGAAWISLYRRRVVSIEWARSGYEIKQARGRPGDRA